MKSPASAGAAAAEPGFGGCRYVSLDGTKSSPTKPYDPTRLSVKSVKSP